MFLFCFGRGYVKWNALRLYFFSCHLPCLSRIELCNTDKWNTATGQILFIVIVNLKDNDKDTVYLFVWYCKVILNYLTVQYMKCNILACAYSSAQMTITPFLKGIIKVHIFFSHNCKAIKYILFYFIYY